MTEYARSRGLSRHTLYAARQMLRRMQGEAGARRGALVLRRTKPLVPTPFATVRLAAPVAAVNESLRRLRAQLPNGVKLEMTWDGAEPALLAAAIGALAGR